MKVPLFLLQNALEPRYKRFYIFFVIPLRGHFRHASPAPISTQFFCFFTDNKPQIYLSVRELFSKKFVFQYALMNINLSISEPNFFCKCLMPLKLHGKAYVFRIFIKISVFRTKNRFDLFFLVL